MKVFFIIPDPLDVYALGDDKLLSVHIFTQRYLACAKQYVYESLSNYVFIPLVDEPYVRQRFEIDFRLHDRIFPIWLPADLDIHRTSEYLFGKLSDWKSYQNSYDLSFVVGLYSFSYQQILDNHLNLPQNILDTFERAYKLYPDAVYVRTYAPHIDFYKIKEFLENRFMDYFTQNNIKKNPPMVSIIGLNNFHFVASSGGKAFLHSNQEHNAFKFLGSDISEFVPPGYNVPAKYGLKGLLEMCSLFKEQGVTKTVIKPVNGSGGRGIFYLEYEDDVLFAITPLTGIKNNFDNYTFPYGDVIIEKYIDCPTLIDIFGDSISKMFSQSILSFSTYYMSGAVAGNPTLQILQGTVWVGSLLVDDMLEAFLTTKGIDSSIFITMNHITYQYARDCGLSGPFGLDFLVDHDHNVFLIDPNNRDTGSVGLRSMMSYLSVEGKSVFLFDFPISKQVNLFALTQYLADMGIFFEINYYVVNELSLLLYGPDYKSLLDVIPIIKENIHQFYL